MACFVVPAAEAIVTTIATKVIEKKGQSANSQEVAVKMSHYKESLSRLNKLLWGGSALLAFEHVWHGEVTPFFPFLTAAANPADAAEMLHEMSVSGVAMALLVTAIWGISNVVIESINKKKLKEMA